MLKQINMLKKKLESLAKLLGDEAERNPRFREQLQAILERSTYTVEHPRRIKTEAPETPDPFDAFRTMGPEKFRAHLGEMRLETLRQIVRHHRLDPSRLSERWKSKDRFVDIICQRVEARAKQGEVFRDYSTSKSEDTNTDLEGKPGASTVTEDD